MAHVRLSEAVDEFERELIVKALQRTGFNQTKAALLLGTSRRILKYRIEKLKINEPHSGEEAKVIDINRQFWTNLYLNLFRFTFLSLQFPCKFLSFLR